MGQLFQQGGLTNTALVDPNAAKPEWFDKSQVQSGEALRSLIKSQEGQVQPSSANISDTLTAPGETPAAQGPTTYNTPQANLSQLKKPSFLQAASMGETAPGAGNIASPALSKAGKLAVFLKSGLEGALAGRAAQEETIAQTGGRRAGGVGQAFQAAQYLPWLRAQQQQGVEKGAIENQMLRAGTQPVPTPQGPMPFFLAKQYAGIQKDISETQKNKYLPTRTGQVMDVTNQTAVPGFGPAPKESNPQSQTFDYLTSTPDPKLGRPLTPDEAYQKINSVVNQSKNPLLGDSTAEQINQMHTQRFQILNPGQPLPAAFTLKPGASQQDYERMDKNLSQMESAQGTKAQRDTANAIRTQTMALTQQKADLSPVIAVDPKTKQRVWTTLAESAKNGYTNPVAVKAGDEEKETQLNSQLNDLQLNASRYKVALNAMGPLSNSDVKNMTRVLSDKAISGYITNELTLGAMMDQISQGEKASAWNALSPDKQDALIGSLRMRNSALLFQKVSTGMGRASKEALDIELSNMPSPIEGATVGNKKLQAFQENVDQMASRSVRLPWMEQPQDVRSRIEGQGVAAYNQAQQNASGQFRPAAGKSFKVGQQAYVTMGSDASQRVGYRKVTKVYPNGTFDAE